MAINPVNVNLENQNNKYSQKPVSFKGGSDFIIGLMDGVNRGGYIAEFVAQDGCGFIAPRILTGLNRNREETGEYNWKFAATEAIRELLSGPCMVIIPWAMLGVMKNKFGAAHDVPIKFIGMLSEDFSKFAQNLSTEQLKDKVKIKKDYYTDVMKRTLNKVTDGKLPSEELNKQTEYFVNEILKIEQAPKKGTLKKFFNKKVEGSADDLMGSLSDKFVSLRKKYSGALENPLNLDLSVINSGKKGEAGFSKFLKHLGNFTNDATSVVSSKCSAAGNSVAKLLETFKHQRIAGRFILILGMDVAVGAFLSIVPKLYKHKDGNPGLKGLNPVECTHVLNHPQEKEGR